MIRCFRVVPADVEAIWPTLSLRLQEHPELWQDWHTMESLINRFQTGYSQLFYCADEATVFLWFATDVKQYPVKNVINVWLMIGERLEECFPPLMAVLREFARIVEARSITAEGRPGFQRMLRKHGAVPLFTTLELKLEN